MTESKGPAEGKGGLHRESEPEILQVCSGARDSEQSRYSVSFIPLSFRQILKSQLGDFWDTSVLQLPPYPSVPLSGFLAPLLLAHSPAQPSVCNSAPLDQRIPFCKASSPNLQVPQLWHPHTSPSTGRGEAGREPVEGQWRPVPNHTQEDSGQDKHIVTCCRESPSHQLLSAIHGCGQEGGHVHEIVTPSLSLHPVSALHGGPCCCRSHWMRLGIAASIPGPADAPGLLPVRKPQFPPAETRVTHTRGAAKAPWDEQINLCAWLTGRSP